MPTRFRQATVCLNQWSIQEIRARKICAAKRRNLQAKRSQTTRLIALKTFWNRLELIKSIMWETRTTVYRALKTHLISTSKMPVQKQSNYLRCKRLQITSWEKWLRCGTKKARSPQDMGWKSVKIIIRSRKRSKMYANWWILQTLMSSSQKISMSHRYLCLSVPRVAIKIRRLTTNLSQREGKDSSFWTSTSWLTNNQAKTTQRF